MQVAKVSSKLEGPKDGFAPPAKKAAALILRYTLKLTNAHGPPNGSFLHIRNFESHQAILMCSQSEELQSLAHSRAGPGIQKISLSSSRAVTEGGPAGNAPVGCQAEQGLLELMKEQNSATRVLNSTSIVFPRDRGALKRGRLRIGKGCK